MPLKTNEIILLGFLGEGIFQFFSGEAEGDVHDGTCFGRSMTAIETTARVDRVIDRICFLAVGLLDLGETTQLLRPLEDQPYHVDGECRRSIVQRSACRKRL